ncbi:flagella basal body P-ring formation protein FlgA [Ruminiclostridium herbifermentans]|uniref:Flagella basal body P-ring formation protein FlgA n=1 Tax=Ruminiclostridium herbifermentans TaxID=2488810 RepID=A0A4U7JIF6_9FIRM|nr:SAF domain-containing protein [Ruminiclostridium herbifermentans]QNU67130.1 flagella basal body P-ring formation protein FlgA [Ruminiclostridium herbifermentans]
MSKRLIIKTALICFGIFLILNTLIFTFLLKKYPLDLEEHILVPVAAVDIAQGTVIQEKHYKIKDVQKSALNSSIAIDIGQIMGKRAKSEIKRNDYIRDSDLVAKGNWFKDDERIIVLPMSIEERLANLIKKGSYVDIRLKRESSDIVETILYKVKVEDVLDEMGNSLDSKASMNTKTAYMELILDEEERQKIYSATMSGKLIFELYCDEMQKSDISIKD